MSRSTTARARGIDTHGFGSADLRAGGSRVVIIPALGGKIAALCAARVVTYHVEDAEGIDVERGVVRHKPIGRHEETETPDWLAAPGLLRIGITAGASTPNNKIGETVARVFATRGIDPRMVE